MIRTILIHALHRSRRPGISSPSIIRRRNLAAMVQQWKAKPYVKTSCSLGEGVCYVEERNEIRFLDINKSKLYHVNLDKGPDSLKEIDTKQPVGVTVDIEGVDSSKIILVGAKDGVTKFNLETGEHEYVTRYWNHLDAAKAKDNTRRMRSNDGAVDSSGRFWVESFVDPEVEDPTEEGLVFRLDGGKTLTTVYENIVIPNGITWNAADDRMHLSDTTVGKIYAFDYRASDGNISNKRVLYQHEGEGHPDGHQIDAEDNLWQALYGGSKVLRISPGGKVIGEVLVPTRNVTCVAFAGTKLFITTAKEDEPEKYPESAKYAGNLFTVDIGIRGGKKHKARLN